MGVGTACLPEPAATFSANSRSGQWLRIVTLAVAAAVPYLPTLGFGFVYDDRPQIVDNRDLLSLSSVPRYFTQPISKAVGLHDATQPVFYRPLFFLQLYFTRTLFGPGPFGFHLFSLLFHIANTLLLYVVAIRLGLRREVAYLAGLLFATHPVHVESVVWPSASPEVMVLAAILSSLLAFLEAQRTSSSSARYAWRALSLTAFLVALFVKETALATLPLVVAIALMEPDRESSAGRSLAINLVLYLGVALFYLLVRMHVLHGLASTITPTSLLDMARTWPSVLWFYERHLLMPMHTSLLYDYDLVEHITFAAFWIPLATVLATLAVAAFCLRRPCSPAVVIAMLLVVVPILLVLNFRIFNWRDLVHDRYLYTPSAGYCILAATALWNLGRWSAKTVGPTVQRILVAGLLCVMALATATQALPWKNNLLLLRNAVEIAPGNISAQMLLGSELESRGHFPEAEICYARALQLTPAWGPAWFAYGRALLLTRDPENAIRSLRRAVELDERPIELVWLALAMDEVGRQQEAQSLLVRAASEDRTMPQVYEGLQRELIAAGN